MAINQLNLGQILGNVSAIQGQQIQNRLGQAQIGAMEAANERDQAFNDVLGGVDFAGGVSGNADAMSGLFATDPERAQGIFTALSSMEEAKLRQIQQEGDLIVRTMAGVQAGALPFDQARQKLIEAGVEGADSITEDDVMGLIYEHADLNTITGQVFGEDAGPASSIGKVFADIESGAIPPEQAQAAIASALDSGGTNVTVTPTFNASDSLVDKLNEKDADRISTATDEADTARATIENINNIRAIGLETGALTSAKGEIAGVMRSIGLDGLADEWIGTDPADVQSFAAFSNRMALENKALLGGGVLSDSDIKILMSLGASPDNIPLANTIILGALERAARMKIAEADAMDAWVSNYPSLRGKGDDAIMEGTGGKTFNQWWNPQKDSMANEMRQSDLATMAAGGPDDTLTTPGATKPISQMTLEDIGGLDLSGMSATQLDALRQRVEQLGGQ